MKRIKFLNSDGYDNDILSIGDHIALLGKIYQISNMETDGKNVTFFYSDGTKNLPLAMYTNVPHIAYYV